MKKPKHKPPSRVRYEENNPVFSTRMPKEWHDELNNMLKDTGQSRKDFMGIALKKQNADYMELKDKTYEEGLDRGYELAKDDYRIWFYCISCGGESYIIPNSNVHKAIIEYLKKQGWGHSECLRK